MGGPALDYARQAMARNAPLCIGKSVDDNGNCVRLKQDSPSTIVVSRSTHPALEACPGMDNHPSIDHLLGMARTMGDFLEGRMNTQEREAIDYIEWWNEPRPHTVEGYRNLAHLMIYTMEESERRGFPPAALFSLNAGTCEWDEMDAILQTGVMHRMLQGGHIWAVHEGLLPYPGFNDDTPILAGLGSAIRNPYTGITSPAFHDAGILCLRYRFWMHKARELGVRLAPFFVSEWYESVHRPLSDLSTEDVITRVREYDAELSKDKLCLGVTPFTLGNGWESENQSQFYPAILDYNVSVRERNNMMADPLDQLEPKTIVVTIPTTARPLPAPIIIQYVEEALPPPIFIPKGSPGIDVSKWQGVINWQAMKDAGITFAGIRATLGITGKDEQFIRNWSEAKRVGIPRIAYHLWIHQLSARPQLDNLLASLGNDLGEFPPVLDVEPVASAPVTNIASNTLEIATWLTECENRLGKRPIIYTNLTAWKACTTVPAWSANYPLWLAQYNTRPVPTVPFPWTSCAIWQHSSAGSVGGTTPIDLDRWGPY